MKKTEAGVAKTESSDGNTDWNIHFSEHWSEMMERSGQAYSKIFTAWRDEMIGFTEKRLQADLDTGRAFYGCRSWAEMVELQQDWLKQAIENYADENSRLMEICREAAETEGLKATSALKPDAKPEAKTETRQEAKHDIRHAA